MRSRLYPLNLIAGTLSFCLTLLSISKATAIPNPILLVQRAIPQGNILRDDSNPSPAILSPGSIPQGNMQRDEDNSTQNRQAEVNRLFQAGIEQYRQGQYEPALQTFQQALVLNQAMRSKAEEARTLHKIGSVYFRVGQYQKALEFYQQALPIRREIGDKAGQAHTFNNMGVVYDRLRQYSQARQFFNQARAIYQEIGDRQGESLTLENLRQLPNPNFSHRSGSDSRNFSRGIGTLLRDDDEVQTATVPSQPSNPQLGTSSGEGNVLPDEGEAGRR
jgi:tetratricopeptide (TPR) repeat protein